MSDQPSDEPGWQPAASRPGEVFTVEGQIAGVGAFARGLKRRMRRSSRRRRSTTTIVVACVAVCAAVVTLVAII